VFLNNWPPAAIGVRRGKSGIEVASVVMAWKFRVIATRVRAKILDVYPGAKFADTCLSFLMPDLEQEDAQPEAPQPRRTAAASAPADRAAAGRGRTVAGAPGRPAASRP
jgi:hypothetical protein